MQTDRGFKYDDASWHNGGDFPAELPPEAGATHIALFVVWAMLTDLAGELHKEDPRECLALRDRSQSPVTWFTNYCDQKFTTENLSSTGNDFAQSYYAVSAGEMMTGPGSYLSDYLETFSNVDELYAVPDSWVSYDKLRPIIDRRFRDWQTPRPSLLRRFFK